MIPYFTLISIDIGPFTLYVWGLFVALGILASVFVSEKVAKQRSQKVEVITQVVPWILFGSFVMARVFYFLYEPTLLVNDPWEFFRIWHGGFSMMGGLVGAVIAGVFFLHRSKADVLAYADTLVFGLPFGMGIGRIGCFLIHDHPGTLTHFVLGVQYPGGVRHDLGLYESLNGFLMFLAFFLLYKRGVKIGTFHIVFLIWYGLFRLIADFYRATDGAIVDTRYAHLTIAQYIGVLMMVAGVWFWQKKIDGKKLTNITFKNSL